MSLPISGVSAVNVEGHTSTSGQLDLYRFYAGMGTALTANTFSHMIASSPTNTSITLFDAMGAPLFSNGDISYSGDTFMGGEFYGSDSLILNYSAPYTGAYYLGVTGAASGDYNLLILGASPVPEPATLVSIAGGLALLVHRRRKR
jgi:hypothetical protein